MWLAWGLFPRVRRSGRWNTRSWSVFEIQTVKFEARCKITATTLVLLVLLVFWLTGLYSYLMLISVVLLLVALPACVLVLLNIGQFRHCIFDNAACYFEYLWTSCSKLCICGTWCASCVFFIYVLAASCVLMSDLFYFVINNFVIIFLLFSCSFSVIGVILYGSCCLK